MSYDFSLRIPAALRKRKGKNGPHPEQLQRLQRAREILLAFEPDLVIEDDDGMFTARSATLGDVYVQYDRISLAMSMGSEPRVVYRSIHTLMHLFRAEAYEAHDPQVRGEIVHRDGFTDFMRQYREHFSCNDEEFEQWCRGETPPAWAERRALIERGDALAARVMPRTWDLDWHQQKALSDDALWEHLQSVIRRNDEAIAAHGLGDYMALIAARSERAFFLHSRRVDGSCYPESIACPWFQGSSLHYEATVLGELMQRSYPAAVRDQPQRVVVFFELAPGCEVSNAHYDAVRATMHPIYPILSAAGLIINGISATGQGNSWEYHFYGHDADAIHAALAECFADRERYQPTRISKRYGDTGARTVEIAGPPAG